MRKNKFAISAIFWGLTTFFAGAFVFLPASGTVAREAGWVPVDPPEKIKARNALSAPKKPAKKTRVDSPVVSRAPNATVYDNQPPVTEKEVTAFVELLPLFRAWARKNGEQAHPVLNGEGKPDFTYSPEAARWVEEREFNAPRFFCVMGKMAAGLVIVEEGNDFKGTRPADMPPVSPQELELVRRRLGELLNAGGPAQPIR